MIALKTRGVLTQVIAAVASCAASSLTSEALADVGPPRDPDCIERGLNESCVTRDGRVGVCVRNVDVAREYRPRPLICVPVRAADAGRAPLTPATERWTGEPRSSEPDEQGPVDAPPARRVSCSVSVPLASAPALGVRSIAFALVALGFARSSRKARRLLAQ